MLGERTVELEVVVVPAIAVALGLAEGLGFLDLRDDPISPERVVPLLGVVGELPKLVESPVADLRGLQKVVEVNSLEA